MTNGLALLTSWETFLGNSWEVQGIGGQSRDNAIKEKKERSLISRKTRSKEKNHNLHSLRWLTAHNICRLDVVAKVSHPEKDEEAPHFFLGYRKGVGHY